jgi:hypothetical protein
VDIDHFIHFPYQADDYLAQDRTRGYLLVDDFLFRALVFPIVLLVFFTGLALVAFELMVFFFKLIVFTILPAPAHLGH